MWPVYYTEICCDCFRTRAGGKQDAAALNPLVVVTFLGPTKLLLLVFISLFAVLHSTILLQSLKAVR